VTEREGIEQGLAEAQDISKQNLAAARDHFIDDVAGKRQAVEGAIASLKEAHYGHGGDEDKRALLFEIHGAKEAFGAAVKDARSDFDELLDLARDASDARLAAARGQFEADLTRKRADLDAAVNGLRTQLADQAAAKRDSLGVALKAAWEDLEEAIAEAAAYFGHAVEAKLAWINKVHYYGLRAELLDRVADLRAAWATQVTGLRQMFADQAEDRRLQADASIAQDQEDFEGFVASVLATCDGNRASQSAALEAALVDRRAAFDELLGLCREAINTAIGEQIGGLKDFLQGQYGYAGHAPGPYRQAPEGQYFDADAADAVQEYVHQVTHPQADQAQHAIAWLAKRKAVLEQSIATTEDGLEAAQRDRGAWEATGFQDSVSAQIDVNGSLAATLLRDVQSKNDAVQATLEGLKHQHYGYQDAHGYRYKLLHQLHHQRVAFEQAVEAAWVSWTQARDLALDTATATGFAAAEAYEGFLAARLGEWEGAAAGVRAALAGQLAEKGEALKGAVQQATKVFQEKQAYKRQYIAALEDREKADHLAHKVDLEDQLYQETVKGIWAGFGEHGRGTLDWLDAFLASEGDDLVAAQDAAGEELAANLGEELDRLGDRLGAIGDAFFQAKHEETQRLMAALYHYGYGDYAPDYSPVFKHEDEEVADPYSHQDEDHYSKPHEDEEYDHEHYEEEEYDHHEPSYEHEDHHEEEHYEEEEHYHEEEEYHHSEPSYHEPSYHEPSYHEPSYHEPSYHEPSYHEPSHHEESYHEESEDDYVSYSSHYSESSYESESSYDHSDHYSHSDHYGHSDHHYGHNDHHDDHVEPYKPAQHYQHEAEAPTQYSAAHAFGHNDLPENVSINVGENAQFDEHSDDSDNDIVINIFNGVGAPPVGKKLEYGCVAAHGQCRPQCPEARYNAHEGTVTVNW
jgi:hypothetical protein